MARMQTRLLVGEAVVCGGGGSRRKSEMVSHHDPDATSPVTCSTRAAHERGSVVRVVGNGGKARVKVVLLLHTMLRYYALYDAIVTYTLLLICHIVAIPLLLHYY